MVKYREIIRQRAMWVSVRNIAFSCKCSTATVRTVIDRSKAKGLEWPLPEEMNDAAIRAVIYPKKLKTEATKAEIDHVRVDKEMERPGVTMMVLWSEYCEGGKLRELGEAMGETAYGQYLIEVACEAGE